jgi:S-disulfanyl-L-cysteine oxidoreductase SoxD
MGPRFNEWRVSNNTLLEKLMEKAKPLTNYFVLFLAGLLLLTGCQLTAGTETGGGQTDSIPPAPTLDPEAVALGQQVYAIHCADCHGVELEGEPNWQDQDEDRSFRAPPHDASGHTWHHGDDLLIEITRLGGARLPANIGGTSNMPAYADILSDEEILAVLEYIKSSWPDDLRQIQWEQTLRERAATSE